MLKKGHAYLSYKKWMTNNVESLSKFYTEAPSKKGEEFSKSSLILGFLNLLAKLSGKEFQGHFADL